MKKSNKIKKDLKQLIIALITTLILISIGYISPVNEVSSKNSNENVENTVINSQISNIPEYSGQIVININENKPYFEKNEMTTKDFENYSNLDELDRAGVAYANICKYTMPPKGTKRESLSYKPSGWMQYLYGENNSKHLYERCHLIAWQLANENNNKKNLITGTSEMNAAMIEYENMVANWIKQKNEQGKDYHVLYRVTPIYDRTNKLATGVEIEAKSVEEDGVSFNKFIYNIQENFEINYATGEAKLIE